MTKTEDRLRDYLGAVADSVRGDNTRPLADPRPALAGAQRRAPRRPGWLAPLTAAASVAVIAAGAVAAGGYLHHGGNSAGPAGTAAGPPRFYAAVEADNRNDLNQIVVHTTASGAVVSRVQDPVSPVPAGTGSAAPPSNIATPNPDAHLMTPLNIATSDDRTFYVLYAVQTVTGYGDLVIESFHISGTGQAGPLIQVNGGELAGHGTTRYTGGWDVTPLSGGFAVSPDNSKIALVLRATPAATAADEILVVDTQTGTQTAWRGGLDRAGAAFAMLGLSWTADSRSLAFLAQWCSPAQRASNNVHSEVCAGTRDAQVRELDTTSPGSSLGSTRVLLAQSARYSYIERAAISPDGASLTALLLSGPVPPDNKGFGPGAPERFAIVRISVATGGVTATLLRGTDSVSEYLTLTVDGSYALLAHADVLLQSGETPYAAGWVDAGHFRRLPPDTGSEAVAW